MRHATHRSVTVGHSLPQTRALSPPRRTKRTYKSFSINKGLNKRTRQSSAFWSRALSSLHSLAISPPKAV